MDRLRFTYIYQYIRTRNWEQKPFTGPVAALLYTFHSDNNNLYFDWPFA